MITGLYAAANGMVAIEEMQAATANNIANAATTGFRRHEPVQEGFYQVFARTARSPAVFAPARAPGGGVKVVENFTSQAAGPLRETGNPLHVALEGPGYIAVDTAQGDRFTRDGAFTIDTDGHLATQRGHKVQNLGGGHIDVRGGQVEIGTEGGIRVDGVDAGQLRVLEFADPQALRRAGDNLYAAPEPVLDASAPAGDTRVVQARLEMANVDLPREMLNLMLGLRAYEANERSIRASDETMTRLIERVGMPV